MRRPIAALLCVLVLSGCGGLPSNGSVHVVPEGKEVVTQDSSEFTPARPVAGSAPKRIVGDFLLAMTAVPLTTSVASAYLTPQGRIGWQPSSATIIYQQATISGSGDHLSVHLVGARGLDERGAWLGPVSRAKRTVNLRLSRVDGEWRIVNPPDAVLIPAWYFSNRFIPRNLYFFDSTDQVLVPEQIYVPRGEDTASTLVRALFLGPSDQERLVLRTAIPVPTQLDLAVRVSSAGVADVPVNPEVARLSADQVSRIRAQLAWTLRQITGISRIRLTAGTTTLPGPDGASTVSVLSAGRYSATIATAPKSLYGLRGGRIVLIRHLQAVPSYAPVAGPFGRRGFALRSFAVSLDGKRICAVAADGRSVFAGPLGPGKNVLRIYDGANVLRPGYTMFGEAWLMDADKSGAKVLVRRNHGVRPVDVPGITGRTIRDFVVSRDGTRLIAIRATQGGAGEVAISTLIRDVTGHIVRVTPARPLRSVPDLGRLTSLTWTSTTEIGVVGVSNGLARMVYASIDGSPGADDGFDVDPLRGGVVTLAGSPDESQQTFLQPVAGGLRELVEGHWLPAGVTGTTAPTYVG